MLHFLKVTGVAVLLYYVLLKVAGVAIMLY